MVFHHAPLWSALVATTLIGLAPPAAAFDPEAQRPGRVLVEFGTGALGTGIGGLAGAGTGLLVCLLGESGWGCLLPAAVSGAVFAFGGMTAGVWLGGEAMGANGGAGWEMLGQVGGAAVAGVLFGLLHDEIDSDELWWTTWIVLPLTGGILGYELSTERTPTTRASALVVPFAMRF